MLPCCSYSPHDHAIDLSVSLHNLPEKESPPALQLDRDAEMQDLRGPFHDFHEKQPLLIDVNSARVGSRSRRCALATSEAHPDQTNVNRSNAAFDEPMKKERLVSLDIFRGMTVVAMIIVDYGGGFWSAIDHSPWNGITFADYVLPAFLFIVGVSLALALKTIDDKRSAFCMILVRFLKLFGLGLLIQGGYLHGIQDLEYGVDLHVLRIMGILQRIVFAYAIVALLEVYRSKKYISRANESFLGILNIYYLQWVAAFIIAIAYLALMYGLYVPDWQFQAVSNSALVGNSTTPALSLLSVQCNVRGSLTPACNAVGFVDRSLMGTLHLYPRPPAYHRTKECSLNSPYGGPLPPDAPSWCLALFDPEGLLSSLPAVLTCFIGAHYGHVLLHVKGHKQQMMHWTVSGCVLLILGRLLVIVGMPLNKQLYTLSYTLVTGGSVALAFTAVFVLVDVYKWRSYAAIPKWIGAHSLLIFALFACDVIPIGLHGIYWKSPQNNLVSLALSVFSPGNQIRE